MSQSSNHGPLKPTPHSESRHSLYTDHSNDSDSPNIHNHNITIDMHQLPKTMKKEQFKSIESPIIPKNNNDNNLTLNHLPKIKTNQFTVFQEHNKPQKLLQNKQETLPRQSLYDVHRKNFQYQPSIISSSPQTQNPRRYNMSDNQHFNSIGNQQQRMLRSSQGGRWFKSRSIMQQRQQRSSQYLLRHYHKQGSLLGQAVSKYMNAFLSCQQNLQKKIYKVSIYDPLQIFKSKMQTYLQKKLNLDNLSIDRPTADWSQQELMKFYTKYQPVLAGKIDQISTLKGVTIKKYKNCVYFGSMRDGQKHGLGVLYYYNNKFFQGLFQDDFKLEGLEMDDNSLYLGQFNKGLRHGQGLLKNDEYLIAGIFKQGQFGTNNQIDEHKVLFGTNSSLNKNTIMSKNGFKIEYSLITIYQNQIVIRKNNIGDFFIGTINEKQQKNGEGLQIFANGDVYIGKYQSGSPEGYGQYYWESGAFYRGQFLSGMRHGKGKWQMIQGDSYQGQYMNDKKNGKGTYIWKNGIKYTGHFENDYRHGYGQMYWQDGRVYKGQWVNGIQSNKTIKLDQHSKTPVKGLNSLPKNSFRTMHVTTLNRRKVPLDKLKSIYNPSNNLN